jgi:hypothetical protein
VDLYRPPWRPYNSHCDYITGNLIWFKLDHDEFQWWVFVGFKSVGIRVARRFEQMSSTEWYMSGDWPKVSVTLGLTFPPHLPVSRRTTTGRWDGLQQVAGRTCGSLSDFVTETAPKIIHKLTRYPKNESAAAVRIKDRWIQLSHRYQYLKRRVVQTLLLLIIITITIMFVQFMEQTFRTKGEKIMVLRFSRGDWSSGIQRSVVWGLLLLVPCLDSSTIKFDDIWSSETSGSLRNTQR